jgi:hypothetical protein
MKYKMNQRVGGEERRDFLAKRRDPYNNSLAFANL